MKAPYSRAIAAMQLNFNSTFVGVVEPLRLPGAGSSRPQRSRK